MLDNLLNTKLKKRLLGIFFTLPQRSFSAFELKQMTGSPVGSVQTALREFLSSSVIVSASRRQKRFFRVNPRFRLYDELSDLISGSGFDAVEDGVAKLLKKLPNVKLGILSGIFTLQPQVPVDIILVGEDINLARVQLVLSEIEKMTGQEVNFSVLSEEEYEYRKMMNDRFIRDILDHPHLSVIDHLK